MSIDTTHSHQLVVIAGAGRAGQLGQAIASHLAAQEYSLALINRTIDEASARSAELVGMQAGQKFTAHAVDLADTAAVTRIAAEVLQAHETARISAVVCVAGGFARTGPIDEADPKAWHQQFAINLDTSFATTRAFLPAVRDARGSFVYFGAAVALPGASPRGTAAYAAAKSGVITFMRTVAFDEKSNGVRANAVAPTGIRTATNLASMGEKADLVERESVAEVVGFLVSHAARHITGQVIRVG